ncbi:hypothetical protein BHE74_00048895 [Ensete ventricosum]|nr:hypothetical protein BHE74_00048895 [Ensete ventricosum]
MADEGTANCVDILLAIIIPPLGVFLKFGCEVRVHTCSLLTAAAASWNIVSKLIVFIFLSCLCFWWWGWKQMEFWICLLLTLFGYIPGIIYAVYAITK